MLFDNIFSIAQNASKTGAATETDLDGYIPNIPTESVTVPPHDPSKPYTPPEAQDPKIVRETSPQAQTIFGLISTLTQTMGQAAKQENKTFNDPSTTISAASPIMKQADQTTSKYPESTPKPSAPKPSTDSGSTTPST